MNGEFDRQQQKIKIHWSEDAACTVVLASEGYPGKYNTRVKRLILKEKPQLYVCGHSHILKVMQDKQNNLLHMNPGACGIHGFHSHRTMLRFEINQGKIENLEAIELGCTV